MQPIKFIGVFFYTTFIWLSPCLAQEEYVVRITAENCAYTDKPETINILTGFILKDKGIVTALHGVCGCKTITAEDASGRGLGKMRITLVDLENDVALLSPPSTMDISAGLEFSSEIPSKLGGKNVTMIGYGHGVKKPKTTTIAKVRNSPLRWLKDCIKNEHIQGLKERKSPDIDTEVLDVEMSIAPGCSGAPVLFNGEVVGIADGGLEGGSTSYCWAIPVKSITLSSKSSQEPEYSEIASKNPTSTLFKSDAKNSEKKFVLKTTYQDLNEEDNCTKSDCLGIKNIQSIEVVSFTTGKRVLSNGKEEYSYFYSEDPKYFGRLKFGKWTNPQCEAKGLKVGVAQGHGWHLLGASTCGTGSGDGVADVIKVSVKISYLELE